MSAADDPRPVVEGQACYLSAADVEAAWETHIGEVSDECRALVHHHRQEAIIHQLDDPALWGRAIDDQRYLVLSLV